MVANFVPAVSIKTVALSCRLRVLRRDSSDFDQALETAEERWLLNVQVEQHIVWKIRGFRPSMTGVTPASLSSARQCGIKSVEEKVHNNLSSRSTTIASGV